MSCPVIVTGDRFLGRVLEHIDCQAQTLGSFGYQALAQADSPASILITSLLTIFIALFGIRLLLGYAVDGRDIVTSVLKIGIVLTLAFSWPAFKTVIYDVTLKGPGEVAAAIAPAGISASSQDLAGRLEAADSAILQLTRLGSGRNIGATVDDTSQAARAAGDTQEDSDNFSSARLAYLAGIIGSLGLLRVLGGLLLAIAPLAAGLLLFDVTRALFAGWLKGLVLTMIGSIGAALVLAVELAVLEPWLADALRVRGLGYAAPSAPAELFALTLAFAAIQLGMLWVLAKIAFYRGWPTIPAWPELARDMLGRRAEAGSARTPQPIVLRDRALVTAGGVERIMRSEASDAAPRSEVRALTSNSATASEPARTSQGTRLGDRAIRRSARQTLAARRRDGQ
ncbi:MAG: type IV secretion system protein [Sphingomonadaceae bacterium]|nr:type IV secretion system protein [Sphingomonadaceae bacterium]